jgi:hypothetical protein
MSGLPAAIPVLDLLPLGGRSARRARTTLDGFLIREIAAIGALYDERSGLDPIDRLWIGRVFDFLAAARLPVADDVHVRPWNLCDGYDILAPAVGTVSADVWILCWIWNPPNPAKLNADPDSNKMSSPHHFDEAVWYRAACAAEVKVVVTFSNLNCGDGRRSTDSETKTEVDGRAFEGEKYVRGPAIEFTMLRGQREMGVLMETLFRREVPLPEACDVVGR